jgi:DNA-binding SARP family transcriptional activator
MLEFRTLGKIELRGDDGTLIPEPLRHTKRIALLAYLATPDPSRSHRRETLIALLWPELDEHHGRGMLRHELYELRRALGPEILFSEGREAVGVDGDRLWCDARAFGEHLAEAQLMEALDLVRGEFLPGLQVNGGEFDRWLDGERARISRRAGGAADRLSLLAATSGDLQGARRWARLWTELAPYDETAWRRLVSLLDRAGDRAGALSAYDELASRLRDDLQIEPAPETRALVEAIRTRAAVATTVDSIPGAQHATGRGEAGDDDHGELEGQQSLPIVIAIRPVENLTGEAGHDLLARRMTDRLAGAIAELHFVEVVIGSETPWATAVVTATLYGHPEGLQTRTRLEESGAGGRVLAAPEPVTLVPEPGDEELDEVVARVLASVAAQYDPRVPIAFVGGVPVRTPSWRAWLEFIQGSEAFGAYRFEEAAHRLRRANEIDPSFVKAGVFAAIALAYCGDPAGAEALATGSLSTGEETATEYERHFAAWLLAELRGRRAEAYRACCDTCAITSHPVFRFLCGREAYRLNRPEEALSFLEGVEPGGQGWWRRWFEIYEVVGGSLHVLGAHHAELDAVSGGRARFPEALEPMRAEVRTRAALGEPRAVLDVVDQAMTVSPLLVTPADVAWTAAQELDAHGHPDAGALARRRGLDWVAHRLEPTHADRLLAVRLLLEVGELEQAATRLQELAPFEALETLDALAALGLTGLVAAAAGDAQAATGVIEQLEGLQNPYLSGRHLLHAAGIRASLGDHVAAIDTLRRALAAGFPFGVELHALPILQPLASSPEFEKLLSPRGVGRDMHETRVAPARPSSGLAVVR